MRTTAAGSVERFVSKREFCSRYGIGPTSFFHLTTNGLLRTVTILGQPRVPPAEIERIDRDGLPSIPKALQIPKRDKPAPAMPLQHEEAKRRPAFMLPGESDPEFVEFLTESFQAWKSSKNGTEAGR